MRIFLSIRVILLPVVIISCHDDIACFPRKSPACYLVRAMRKSCAGRFGLRGRSPLSAHDSGSGSACAKVIILFCLNEGMRFLFHLICENRRMVEFVARVESTSKCKITKHFWRIRTLVWKSLIFPSVSRSAKRQMQVYTISLHLATIGHYSLNWL